MKFLFIISIVLFSSNIFSSSLDNYCPRLLENTVSEDCLEKHKKLEEHVINRITLSGTLNISEIVIGSYTTRSQSIRNACEYHFVVKYERENANLNQFETIFRYFHFNNMGALMDPSELMLGNYFPKSSKASNSLKTMDNYIEPTYRCEQRLEWEWEAAKDIIENCSKSFSGPIMGSIVFPRKNYPFCNYQIFGIYFVDKEIGWRSDVEFVHYIYNENGMNFDYVRRLGFPIRLKGRKIEYPKPLPEGQ